MLVVCQLIPKRVEIITWCPGTLSPIRRIPRIGVFSRNASLHLRSVFLLPLSISVHLFTLQEPKASWRHLACRKSQRRLGCVSLWLATDSVQCFGRQCQKFRRLAEIPFISVLLLCSLVCNLQWPEPRTLACYLPSDSSRDSLVRPS